MVPVIVVAFIWVHSEPVKKSREYLKNIFRPVTWVAQILLSYVQYCFFGLIGCCAWGRRWTHRYYKRKLATRSEKEFQRKMQDLKRGKRYYDEEEVLEKLF